MLNKLWKIPNLKHQITNKSQIPISKSKTNLFLKAFLKVLAKQKLVFWTLGF